MQNEINPVENQNTLLEAKNHTPQSSTQILPKVLMLNSASIALIAFAFAAVCFGITNLKSLGLNNPTSITVLGESEVKMVPDLATIDATIREFAPAVAEAQSLIDAKTKALEASLEKLGVDKKDVRSVSYSTKPKYAARPECEANPCKYKYKIAGYEAMQTIQIKVHKVDNAGEVVTEIGKIGINEITGPNFAINDSEKPKADARASAIKNSRIKAQSIAKALNTKIGRVVGFSEDNFGEQMAFAKTMTTNSDNVNAGVSIPTGENVVKSRVTVTYSLE